MMSRILLCLPLALFILVFILFKSHLNKDPTLLPSLLLNQPVPNFSSRSLDGKEIKVTGAELRGKIVLLNVWASWCSGCQIEHPILMDMAKSQQIVLYGLNYKDNKKEALTYLAKSGNPYLKILYDPQGSLGVQFGVYGTPETFLIDKKGIIRYRYVGPITLDILEKDLMPRIKQIEAEDL